MTNLVDTKGTCQVIDLAEFKAARTRRRIGNREAQMPADGGAPEQLPLLPEASPEARGLGRPARVRQVPHRQRMLAHLEAVSAASATQPV